MSTLRLSLLFVCLSLLPLPAHAQDDRAAEGLRGTVLAIDAERGTMRLRAGDGSQLAIATHTRTVVRREGGADMALGELHVGDVVAIIGEKHERYFLADEVRLT